MSISSLGNKIAAHKVELIINRDPKTGTAESQYLSFTNRIYTPVGFVDAPGTIVEVTEAGEYLKVDGSIDLAGIYDSTTHQQKLYKAGIVVDGLVIPPEQEAPL